MLPKKAGHHFCCPLLACAPPPPWKEDGRTKRHLGSRCLSVFRSASIPSCTPEPHGVLLSVCPSCWLPCLTPSLCLFLFLTQQSPLPPCPSHPSFSLPGPSPSQPEALHLQPSLTSACTWPSRQLALSFSVFLSSFLCFYLSLLLSPSLSLSPPPSSSLPSPTSE